MREKREKGKEKSRACNRVTVPFSLFPFPLLVGLLLGLPQSRDILLATTTSVRDTGLLDELIPPFERASGYRVKVVAVGSGQAMELGRRGEPDILILHDPAGEERFAAEGLGVDRRPLMHNEFVLVGPPGDPAKVRGVHDAADAMAAIAGARARYVSRGDRSGTQVKQDTLLGRRGIRPDTSWFLEAGQGMSATLQIANELRAYTLTDIGTFLSHASPLGLVVVVEGDTALHNPYHVIRENPARFPRVNQAGARALADYLTSTATRRRIAEYRKQEFGRSLFIPESMP
ncbi:MAG: substrate-binding domain-containing protein [Gemmatimonadetes bacterium]|nr:substrate-binding domain-containing protein [Gemmatimonadota bacterium]